MNLNVSKFVSKLRLKTANLGQLPQLVLVFNSFKLSNQNG